MTTGNLLLPCPAFTGLGVLLACVLWVSMSVAQTHTTDDGTDLPTTSISEEDLQGNDDIDYENAQPMPMPSLPDPAPSDTLPIPPTTGESMGLPGSSPGSTGAGEETPEVLIPPKSPAEN